MKKKVFSALTAALLSVSILAGCSQDTKETAKKTDDKKKETVAVTLNEVAHSIFYAPMYVAIEEGYFEEEGIDLKLVTGFGADKTMTAVLSNQADIGFMGSESSIYTYNEGAKDYVVNFAQLTQRAGNFLVSREPMEDFQWTDLKGKTVLGGRKGGMPEMVFEYILKQNGIDPEKDLTINRNIDFGSTAAAFSGGQGDFTVVVCIKQNQHEDDTIFPLRNYRRGIYYGSLLTGFRLMTCISLMYHGALDVQL